MPIRLKLTPHLQARQVERHLEIDHIKKAIAAPDSEKVVFGDRKKVRKRIGEKEIVVVYYKDAFRDKENTYIIITAYYL